MENHVEDDGLRINYDEETGELKIEWDKDDPRWSCLKDITEEQIISMLTERCIETMEGENGTSITG